MSSPSRVPDALIESHARAPQVVSLGWALRRAALGLLILTAMVVLGAWLFYASIDVDEAVAGPSAPAESAAPPR